MTQHYTGTLPEDISPDALRHYLTYDNVVVMDIREASAFSARHIIGAVSLPAMFLQSEINQLEDDMHYIVVCEHGLAAQQAAQFLRDNDFSAAFLRGGNIAVEETLFHQ